MSGARGRLQLGELILWWQNWSKVQKWPPGVRACWDAGDRSSLLTFSTEFHQPWILSSGLLLPPKSFGPQQPLLSSSSTPPSPKSRACRSRLVRKWGPVWGSMQGSCSIGTRRKMISTSASRWNNLQSPATCKRAHTSSREKVPCYLSPTFPFPLDPWLTRKQTQKKAKTRQEWPWSLLTSPSESVVGDFLTRSPMSPTWALLYCPTVRILACISYSSHVSQSRTESTVTHENKPSVGVYPDKVFSWQSWFTFASQDHNAAFKSKTTMEVLRALVVFQLCGINKLVDNNEMVSFVIDLIHKMSPTKNLTGI